MYVVNNKGLFMESSELYNIKTFAMFVVNNKGLFMENSELYNIKTRNNSNLYQPSPNLTISQKGPY